MTLTMHKDSLSCNANTGLAQARATTPPGMWHRVRLGTVLCGTIGVVIIAPLSHSIALDWGYGLLIGVVNAAAIARSSEHLLLGRLTRSRRTIFHTIRLFSLGMLVFLSSLWGPWWSMGVVLAGIALPFLLVTNQLARYDTRIP